MHGDDDDTGGPDGHDEDLPRPLDRHEAARVRKDLDELTAFRHTFEPQGFKGVSVFCDDCVEEHYYEWSMLEGNLLALLEAGETPVHEPAFDPRPEDYINWDYAQGYLDGVADAGGPVQSAVIAPAGGCPFCGVELPGEPDHLAFCPTCGTHLGPARVAAALLERGWSADDVADLLRAARIPPLLGLDRDQGQRAADDR